MKIINRRWAKIASVLVLIVSALMIAVGLVSISAYEGLELDLYDSEAVISRIYEDKLMSENYRFANAYMNYIGPLTVAEVSVESRGFAKGRKNYVYRVIDNKGNILSTNYVEGDLQHTTTQSFPHTVSEHPKIIETYSVESSLLSDMSRIDEYALLAFGVGFVAMGQFNLILITVFFAFIFILSFVLIIKSLGRRPGVDGIVLRRVDRIPTEIAAIGYMSAIMIAFGMISNRYYADFWPILILVISGLIAFDALLSLILRIKSHTLFSNSLIGRTIPWLRKSYAVIPIVRKGLMVYLVWVIIELIILIEFQRFGLIVFWLLKSIVIGLILVRVLLDMKLIETSAEVISLGNINHAVDTKRLLSIFRHHGENLNAISKSVEIAVMEQTKSERMKTELITNVSHDIKTPLTSILNYVDLLSKEDLDNEKAVSYLEPLNRQSQKLAKLVDDLLVASRVNSGSIEVNLEPMKINIFVEQTAGEFLERMEEKNLQLIVSGTEETIEVMGDQQFMSRTLDNLLTNVINYSLENSRVYLSLECVGSQVLLMVRNISKEALNVDEVDLLERFVRGDSSRNTEGNGLGLSIAKSMVELQGGNFELSIDGDLFKVVCSFDIQHYE